MIENVAGAEITIDAAPETVWHAIVGAKTGLMPGTSVESDWQLGHPITFSGEWQGRPFKDYGEIVALEDGRAVAFSHWSGKAERPDDYHIVRYTLTPQGERTHVTLTQSNVGPHAAIDEKTRAEFSKNWAMMLAHLKKAAEAG